MVSTLAGCPGRAAFLDGPGHIASFNGPGGIAVALGQGNVLVADCGNHRIRKITPQGHVVTLAGCGDAGFADGPGGTASFNDPVGVGVDSDGNVVVADSG